jgi:peptidoglycan/xylan/chitin deacetylase (PgdA/CDA1 family)
VSHLTQGIRPTIRHAWALLLHFSGCLWMANRQLRRRGAVVVLTFHRVLEDVESRDTCSLPGMVVRRATFEKLAAYVAGKYKTVDVAGATGAASANAGAKMRVMFTFDDGWRDNYTNAVPVTRAHGIPVTIFICPGLVGRMQPFWPEQAVSQMRKASKPVSATEIEPLIERLKTYSPKRRAQFIRELCGTSSAVCNGGDRTISWDDIRSMDAAGVRFGAHSDTHQILTAVPSETARREIRESRRAIEAALGKRCGMFAYPNGNYSSAVQQMLREEGFTAAFTTERGAWIPGADPLAIPRVNVSDLSVTGISGGFSPVLFQYSVFWRAWRALQSERRLPAKRREAVLSEA